MYTKLYDKIQLIRGEVGQNVICVTNEDILGQEIFYLVINTLPNTDRNTLYCMFINKENLSDISIINTSSFNSFKKSLKNVLERTDFTATLNNTSIKTVKTQTFIL